MNQVWQYCSFTHIIKLRDILTGNAVLKGDPDMVALI